MKLDNINDDMSAADITDILIQYWGLKGDADLERTLAVGNWSVGQYRKRKTADIQTKMIIALLRDIAYLEKKLSQH